MSSPDKLSPVAVELFL